MYGVLLPVTGAAIGLYAIVAVAVVIIGTLMKHNRKEKPEQ